ncbi:sigma-70 family RNA polymerase sigma factor [Agreia sp.]|uniref:sigma-70 family RNA polymerase sigma factor n=1 Tax=Agreia sp. TaxID=1872416 RepID=UPI0035BBD9E7
MLKLVTPDSDHDGTPLEALDSVESLLLKVADGDQRSFAELYDRIAPRVLGLIKRLLIDHSQSEEVAQEVFLEIWRTATRFDPSRGAALSWVLTMAHRRAVDRVRASQSSHDRDIKIGIRDVDREYDQVAESVEIRIEHERVKRAMTQLTQLQREAISLAYYGGYSHSEVAKILAIPIGTVKTRLRDGMIRLRDEMGVA